jgi:hypothetical protein
MSEHLHHRFSVTIHTDDRAIVGCLRALAEFSQKYGNNKIPCDDTKDEDWNREGHRVTFRFSTAQYRDGLIAEAKRLLPKALWHLMATSDHDPASLPDR